MAEVAKTCPFLPPIPNINAVSGRVESLSYQVCLGLRCALWTGDTCVFTGLLRDTRRGFPPATPGVEPGK